jgi:menaquinone-9 beta-reductase
MSVALHTGKIAYEVINKFLTNVISREQMEQEYSRQWKHYFFNRLRTGRVLQRFFGGNRTSNFFVQAFKTFPFLSAPLIRMTHGRPF